MFVYSRTHSGVDLGIAESVLYCKRLLSPVCYSTTDSKCSAISSLHCSRHSQGSLATASSRITRLTSYHVLETYISSLVEVVHSGVCSLPSFALQYSQICFSLCLLAVFVVMLTFFCLLVKSCIQLAFFSAVGYVLTGLRDSFQTGFLSSIL